MELLYRRDYKMFGKFIKAQWKKSNSGVSLKFFARNIFAKENLDKVTFWFNSKKNKGGPNTIDERLRKRDRVASLSINKKPKTDKKYKIPKKKKFVEIED